MKSHATLVFATASITSSCLLLGGCEDSSARHRDQVQAQIRQANMKLKKALAGSNEDAAPALSTVVADLSRIDGGEPGQQAAKALLSATALREFASIKLAQAEQIEAAHRLQRNTLHANVDAAMELAETAAALESIDAVAERQQIQREIESARTAATELRTRLDQLDGPITERATQNASNKAEVDALRLKVNELRRRAQELGHANGFETYQEAVETARQADKIEYEIAQREIDLEHSLTPELTMTDAEAQQVDALIKSLETANAQLDAFASATANEISGIRKQVADYVSLAEASINEIDSQRSGELARLYDEAQSSLEKAASQTRSAATQHSLGQNDMQAARVAGVQSQEMLGRMHWSKAQGAVDHQRLIDRLATVPGASTSLAEKARALAEQHKQSLEQAKASYEAAQEQAGQVQSQSNPGQVETLNKNIESAIASLSGTKPPPAAATIQPAGTPAGTVPALPEHEVPVFQTADELRDYLTNLPKNGSAMRATVAVMHASTPTGERMKKAATDMTNAFVSIDDAMRAKFGTGLFDLLGPMANTMTPDFAQATVSEQTDDRVVYTRTVMGQTSRTVIRKIDGTWKIDVDDLDAQTTASLPMIEQMAASMAKAAPAMVSRIESGEFANAQQVMVAFGQAMAGGAAPGSMPGAPPRMPGRPPGQ